MLDDLQDRATSIAAKLEGVLDDVHDTLQGPIVHHVEATLASVRRSALAAEELFSTSAPRLTGLLEQAARVTSELEGTLVEVRAAAIGLKVSAASVDTTMQGLDGTVRSVGATVERIASASVEPLIDRINMTMGRVSGDIRSALDRLVQGVDSIGALADMLHADPSSLILGKSGEERELP
jgi:ABC-type transporter Mla subunit MlaD